MKKSLLIVFIIVIVIISIMILNKSKSIEDISITNEQESSMVFNSNSGKYEYYNDLGEFLYESENKEEVERYQNDYETIYRDMINEEINQTGYKESDEVEK